MGRRIPLIDCKGKPTTLEAGDILIAASDGLQFLSEAQIETVLRRTARRPSAESAEALLAAVERLRDPDQDNVSFAIIKIR